MTDLVIESDEFTRARSVSLRVIEEFDRTERVTSDTAGLTGHAGLSATVQQFADGWDVGRGKLRDNLQFLAEGIDSILETFADLDGSLAGSLEGVRAQLSLATAPVGGASDNS